MIAPSLISDSIPPLHLEDTGEHALITLQEFNVSQLPVLDGNKYVGLITIDEIIHQKHLSQSIQSFQLPGRNPFVLNTAHIFDVMKAAVEFNVRVVPVVDEDGLYLGLISAESCLRGFAVLNSVKDSGAIIEMEIAHPDYSLSEIARISEENSANILCFYTNIRPQDGVVEITLKLNTTDVTTLIAAFERFDYEIKSVYNDSEFTEELKDRYDGLMRYLNV